MNDEKLEDIGDKVDKMYALLAGNEFTEGMVAKQRRNHDRIGKLEDSQKKWKWFGTIAAAFITGVTMFKDDILKHWKW